MKKAFISGTKNQKVIAENEKLLSVIDYSSWTALPSPHSEFSLDVKKDRIKMILDSDAFVTRDNLSGPNFAEYDFELKLALYMDLPIIIFGPIEGERSTFYKRLDSLVAERVLENLQKAEEENNSKEEE